MAGSKSCLGQVSKMSFLRVFHREHLSVLRGIVAVKMKQIRGLLTKGFEYQKRNSLHSWNWSCNSRLRGAEPKFGTNIAAQQGRLCPSTECLGEMQFAFGFVCFWDWNLLFIQVRVRQIRQACAEGYLSFSIFYPGEIWNSSLLSGHIWASEGLG